MNAIHGINIKALSLDMHIDLCCLQQVAQRWDVESSWWVSGVARVCLM